MACLHESHHNRKRQDPVSCLDRLVKAERQPRLLGQGAIPFSIVAFEPTKLPLRQFEFDQSECRIGMGAGFG